MPTHTLYNRRWRVRVNDLVFDSVESATPLYVEFEVTKTLYALANTGKVTLYNLTESHRTSLARLRQSRRRIRVEISAGYGDNCALLFAGDVRGFMDEPSGTEAITTLEGSDGGPLITDRRFPGGGRTYPAGTRITTPIRDMVGFLTIGEGNVREIETATLGGTYRTLPRPKTFRGLVSEELTGYLRSLGYTWSIQNGAFQVLRNGSALGRTGVLLSATTGLIEAHFVDRRTIKVLSFLIPEIAPGYRIIVNSQRVEGDFRVHSVKYRGSPDGDFMCETECRIPRPNLPY